MSETTVPLAQVASPSAARTAAQGRRDAARVPRSRGAGLSLGALQIVLALFYGVASALPKLMAHPSAVEPFEELGWGDPGMYAIGALELAGAVALVIPLLSSVAATALGALMVGAFVVNLMVLHGPYVVTPLVLILPLAVIAWARRHHTVELIRLVRRRV
ncbi:DoxX family protein [Streptomyces sp. NPDC008313]|uniref:DoxX family protein n=1 Tax=Streptomyces sp. NPDC008313 TaxID=3364826 RepID=UPI0036E44F84